MLFFSLVDLASSRHTSPSPSLSPSPFVFFCPSPVAVVTSRGKLSGGEIEVREGGGEEGKAKGGGGLFQVSGWRNHSRSSSTFFFLLFFFLISAPHLPKPCSPYRSLTNYLLSFASLSSLSSHSVAFCCFIFFCYRLRSQFFNHLPWYFHFHL